MSRFDWLRRVRGRSTEEQMLGTMLVAGVVFAIVALVAFLRPGGQSAAGVHGPQVRTAQTNANAPQGSSTHVAVDQGVTPDAPAGSDAQTITQKLQRLFGAVVTPLGFTTDLPPLIKTATPVSANTGNPNAFPTTFPSLPGKLPPPPPTLPPPPPTLPPTTDTLPPPTTLPPTTLPPTTLPPTTVPPTTVTTAPPTTATTAPPTTDTTAPPTTDTTAPPTTDTQPATTSSSSGLLPGVPLP